MVIREVDTGLRPDTFIHINIVDYTLSTQDYLKNVFQGVREDKNVKKSIKDVSYIHIKIMLIIIIQVYHHNFIQTCHINLIQACHLTLFVSVNIALILLYMHLMEFHTNSHIP